MSFTVRSYLDKSLLIFLWIPELSVEDLTKNSLVLVHQMHFESTAFDNVSLNVIRLHFA